MKPQQRRDLAPARTIKCPACGGPSRYAGDNAFRPFCSERCRSVDLGAWASERYRVPVAEAPEEDTASGQDDQGPPRVD
jgi:endogenous inhibitor of DNA gyrase (YacG/DUF329 family)